ncbi:hypothetical protein [Actinoplanes aureus]|uniref:Uncharacterized protein n=1 Tax=Actinoplanes aureus TaxID=2792083 RepID=A0A931FW63_9ACTN|nr:hypothetical protein [Actinoplanes aureus]MBG0561000.1 hypothetical protein [Actinoplanes aureus]
MNPRYAARTAAFAAVYLAAFLASGPLGPAVLVPPIAVAALWLVAQSRYGLRRFDVIALTTASMVAATLEGAGILLCLAVAVWAVAPAVLFAVLLERWLPGYWLGHGDRFRRPRASLGRLAGAAALTAVAGLVIQEVTNPGTGSVAAGLQLLRDTAAIVLPILAVRAVRRTRAGRRTRSPRRGALSMVR